MTCREYPNPDMGCVGQVINLYLEALPHTDDDRAAYDALQAQLPPPMQHGLRARVWSQWYPEVPYPGLTVGMRDVTVVASNEVLVPYATFDMASVPWEKL